MHSCPLHVPLKRHFWASLHLNYYLFQEFKESSGNPVIIFCSIGKPKYHITQYMLLIKYTYWSTLYSHIPRLPVWRDGYRFDRFSNGSFIGLDWFLIQLMEVSALALRMLWGTWTLPDRLVRKVMFARQTCVEGNVWSPQQRCSCNYVSMAQRALIRYHR